MPDSGQPSLTWRIVSFSCIAAAVSLIAFVFQWASRGVPRGGWAAAIIVAMAGLQILNARRLFAYTAPAEIRSWMRPAGWGLCVAALALVAISIWAGRSHP
jgi:hypothetical protein